jgi:hydroxyacylglutathione hydrolase
MQKLATQVQALDPRAGRGPDVVGLVDEGLGNSTYLVDLGDGRALVVDPSRDLRAVRAAAARRGLTIGFAADTHLHADFLTGACQLAATDGTQVLASAAGRCRYPHRGLRDGDEVNLGGLRLHAIATPGHTDEHLALLLLDGDLPIGVFTGGSLLVGSAARTDLVDPDRTEELARAQYASLQRLLCLPDPTIVWPTHGAGSFCSAPPGADRISTIGRERATNVLLQAGNQDFFVARLLQGLGSFPPYFLRLRAQNQRGPGLLADVTVPALDVDAVRALRADGAEVIDVRPVPDYAAGHIPGSLSIPLRPAFATWLGWLAPHDRPLIVLRGRDQDPGDVFWQAAKVGYDTLAGEVGGGIDAWAAGGGAVTTSRLVAPDQIGDARVLDIRQRGEFATGHVPGARNIELGALPGKVDEVPKEPTVLMCGHGERAAGAAALLERAGHRDLAILLGGPDDVVAATGGSLRAGP